MISVAAAVNHQAHVARLIQEVVNLMPTFSDVHVEINPGLLVTPIDPGHPLYHLGHGMPTSEAGAVPTAATTESTAGGAESDTSGIQNGNLSILIFSFLFFFI